MAAQPPARRISSEKYQLVIRGLRFFDDNVDYLIFVNEYVKNGFH